MVPVLFCVAQVCTESLGRLYRLLASVIDAGSTSLTAFWEELRTTDDERRDFWLQVSDTAQSATRVSRCLAAPHPVPMCVVGCRASADGGSNHRGEPVGVSVRSAVDATQRRSARWSFRQRHSGRQLGGGDGGTPGTHAVWRL